MSTKKLQKVLLVFFSGTGGVKKIADAFENQLIKKNIPVIKHSLDQSEFTELIKNYNQIIDNITLIILLYPVHAFNAPLPVFNWIEILPPLKMIPAAIISVSGGGEVSLNRASRFDCIKALEKKGSHVFYETMMVMPSNWYIPTPDYLAVRLIQCIPEKTKQIIDQIISGKQQRTSLNFFTRITASFISWLERTGVKEFGKGLRVSSTCTGCMWCIRHCPQDNIHLSNGQPEFGIHCIMCFRCIYGCPDKSIYATKVKFMVIKDGFNLETIEKRMAGVDLEPLDKYGKGLLWNGVKNYLLR